MPRTTNRTATAAPALQFAPPLDAPGTNTADADEYVHTVVRATSDARSLHAVGIAVEIDDHAYYVEPGAVGLEITLQPAGQARGGAGYEATLHIGGADIHRLARVLNRAIARAVRVGLIPPPTPEE